MFKHWLKQTICPESLTKQFHAFYAKMGTSGHKKVSLLLGIKLWKWLKQNFLAKLLIVNWTGPNILGISTEKLPKMSALL